MNRLVAVIILLVFLPGIAMAVTASGTYVSGTVSYDPGAWTNPDSAFASDDRRAAIVASSADSFAVRSFGIDIPLYAIIDSIDTKVEGNGGSATTLRRVYYTALSKDGGVTKVGNWATDTANQTTDAVQTIATNTNGEGTRLWNTTWTASEIVSANFAVMIKKTVTATGSTNNIDHIQVAVWWHVPSSTKANFYLGAGNGNEADVTYLSAANPTTNYGTDGTMVVGDSGVGSNHVLIRWGNIADSLLSGNEYITACTLFVATKTNANTNGIVKVATPRRADWSESQATWNIYKTASNWTTAGAKDTTTDIDTVPRLEYGADDFVANAYTAIDITNLALLMDGADSANWRKGLMLYGVWTFDQTWKDSIGFNSAVMTLVSDDTSANYLRPYIHVVTQATPFFDGEPRPAPQVNIYGPSTTGLRGLNTGLVTKSLGKWLHNVGFDSAVMKIDSNSTGIHRMVTTANGGTSFTHHTTSFPNSVSGTMWTFGDSGWVTTFLTNETVQKPILKWSKVSAGIYDTILAPASRVGDRFDAVAAPIVVPLASGSLLAMVRMETGATDSVILIKSNGAHTQTSTWTEVDKGASIVGLFAQFAPMPDRGGFVWWSGDSLFWADSTGGFDTVSTDLTDFASHVSTPSYLCRTIIPVGDSSFLVAYQVSGGDVKARLGYVTNVGAGAGTVGWTAAATTLELNADLPAPITQTTGGGQRFLAGNACPTLSKVIGSNTVFCFWYHWAVQPSGRADVRYDNPRVVYKLSTDRGATWDASRTVLLDTNTAGMPHTQNGGSPNKKVGLVSTPTMRTYQQKYQAWLAWSDSISLAGGDTLRLAKINISTDTGVLALGRGADEAIDNKLRQQLPTTNYGTDTVSAFGGLRGDGAMYVAVMTFPGLAANLLGKTVDSAKLTLRMILNSAPINDAWAFQILRQPTSDSLWSETQSTWRLRKTGQDWRDSGAHYVGTDIRNSTNYNQFTHSSYIDGADNTYDVTTLLKAMDGVAADTASTITVRSISGDGTTLNFKSANVNSISHRPYLRVWWHSGVEGSAALPARRRREMGVKEQIGAYSITAR